MAETGAGAGARPGGATTKIVAGEASEVSDVTTNTGETDIETKKKAKVSGIRTGSDPPKKDGRALPAPWKRTAVIVAIVTTLGSILVAFLNGWFGISGSD